ncbi:MAG: ABC transporter ATP-binding protein [Bacilli bacterium]
MIEIKNVSKSFGKVEVLKNINLKLKPGRIYGLIGRNGSGKTVFLKMLCAFYKPTEGEILFDVINIIKENMYPPDTRALIEKPCFLPDLTGYDNLKILADIQNIISDNEIINWCKKLNIDKELDKKYCHYSLGTKQKLGIVQVLMEDPKIIILDEPLNGIENKTAGIIREILKEEKKNKIIIIASHIREDIINLADEVFEFDDGNIITSKM